jgi:type IV secretory pathway TrbL component
LATLQERIRRAEQAVAREAEQAKQAKLQTAISFGATLLGAMVGRKAVSRSSVGRATTAARGVGRSMKQAQDVDRARATVEATVRRLADLEAEFEAETEEIREKYDPALEDLETVVVRPKKKDIAVKLVALAWAPQWQRGGEVVAAWE